MLVVTGVCASRWIREQVPAGDRIGLVGFTKGSGLQPLRPMPRHADPMISPWALSPTSTSTLIRGGGYGLLRDAVGPGYKFSSSGVGLVFQVAHNLLKEWARFDNFDAARRCRGAVTAGLETQRLR